jgi:peroxiredoxin
MRNSILFSATLITLGALGGSVSHAQVAQGPEAPQAGPTFMLDKKGKRDIIDFNIALKPVSNQKLTLAQFKGRRTLVFYYSAKCPHCQQSAPYVQQLADELGPKGYASLAVAIKWNTEDDIRGFIRDFGVRMPMMQDDDRTFGENYGVGTIPVVYLINEKGEYIRWTSFNGSQTQAQIRSAAASWPSVKK